MQCEFNGRQVQHTIPNTPKEAFNTMFYKSWMSARVSNAAGEDVILCICAGSLFFIILILFKGLEVMSYGEGIKIDLPKPPRKLTRLVLRTVDTQEVEHMSEGDVIIYGQVINVGRRSKKPRY